MALIGGRLVLSNPGILGAINVLFRPWEAANVRNRSTVAASVHDSRLPSPPPLSPLAEEAASAPAPPPSLLDRYRALIDAGKLRRDAGQEACVLRLDRLCRSGNMGGPRLSSGCPRWCYGKATGVL